MIVRCIQLLLLLTFTFVFGSAFSQADEYSYLDAWSNLIEDDFYPLPNGQLVLSTEKANLEHFEIGIEFKKHKSKISYYQPGRGSLLNQVKYIFNKNLASSDVEDIARKVFFEKKSFDTKLCSGTEIDSKKLVAFILSSINSFDSNQGSASINNSKFKPSKDKMVLDGSSYLITLRLGDIKIKIAPEVTSEVGLLYAKITNDIINCSKEVEAEKIYLSN